jgi:hypothetical protein
MSHPSKIIQLQQAKALGYMVEVYMDDHYILQTVGKSFVVHDRLLLKPGYSLGQMRVITYCEGVG